MNGYDAAEAAAVRRFGEYLRAEAAPHIGRDPYWDGVDWAGRQACEVADEAESVIED